MISVFMEFGHSQVSQRVFDGGDGGDASRFAVRKTG